MLSAEQRGKPTSVTSPSSGCRSPTEGVFSSVKRFDKVPALVDMDVVDAIRDGSIEVVATVESFDGDKVVLVDGSRLDPHAAIFATGFRPRP